MAEQRVVIKVGIATAGRRTGLSQTLIELAKQSRQPDEVIVAPASPEDCDETTLDALPYASKVVHGSRGLSAQRNTIVEACGKCDIIVFFDDDFYPESSYLANLESVFQQEPNVVGVTGSLLADGSVTEGISHDQALSLIAQYQPPESTVAMMSDTYALYGCNMALRFRPVEQHGLRFDERLPLYGWLEDIDLTRRLGHYGRLVKVSNLTGVHLAIKSGRTSGLRLGYSQIANPWYLVRKGSFSPKYAFFQVSRNVAANLYRSLKPEPWVDRRGRLRGNALAAVHLVTGRIDPSHILNL